MLPLFIVDEIADRGDLTIGGDEAHHLLSSLRITAGERIAVTDGAGRSAEVEVTSISKRSLTAKIISVTDEARAKTVLTVVQALTKGDRARETIELLTEAGADLIVPWAAARSIGQWREDKDALARWRSWAREATKQSRRAWLPQVTELATSKDIAERIASSPLALMFHESGSSKLSESLVGPAPREITIIIGPEGGINESEAAAFIEAGAKSVVMGRPVFRSAHAGIAALAAIQSRFGIW